LPIALVDATELLVLNADVLVVGLFLPPESVAIYFAATRIAQILDYVRYSGSAATAQRFAALAATGSQSELHRLIALVTIATSALALAGALVLWAAAPLLLTLFGPDFAPAAWLVPLLAAGIVTACVCGPGEDVLTMLGQERACALSFGLALVVNLVLLFLLVPAFGLAGAAIASAATMACRSLLLAAYAYARLGILLPLGLSWRQAHVA
jgi:O-antigen/teichoic acid export membrane protein